MSSASRQAPFWILVLLLCTAAVRAETIDDVVGRCPTAAEIAAINAAFTITFEGTDPSGTTLVCTAAAGSQNLTKLMRNVYNVMLAAQKIHFSTKFPWSGQTTVWDWLRLESGIGMIRIRADIGGSYCCDPPNAVDLQAAANSYYTFGDKWVEDDNAGGGLVSALALVVHEARHHNAGGHTCGTNDQTVAELGAWGSQIYFYLWLDRYADRAFLRPNSGDPDYYRNLAIQTAEDLKRTICAPPTLVTSTVVEFYNSILNHYFMTISAAEATAIDGGSAGPGWSRTGVTFKAWTDPATAPYNVRPVYRFYGSTSPGPNSHFYTAAEDEYLSLVHLQSVTPANQPRWNFEGVAFYIGALVRGSPASQNLQCGQIPNGVNPLLVNRFYNNRALQNDSNHRYTVRTQEANQMTQAGWSAEGRVMCSTP